MLDENKQQNQKMTEKEKLENAGAKTAHVAGKAAASYFGGKLGNVAYDKLSKTKLGQNLERGVGGAISKLPSLSAGRGSGIKNSLGAKKEIGVGAGSSETPKALQKRTGMPSFRRNLNTSNVSQENNDENIENNEESSEDNMSTPLDTLTSGKGKASVMMKLLPIILPIVIGLLFVVLIVLLIGGIGSMISSFLSLDSFGSSNPSYVYNESETQLIQAEKNYNQAIIDTVNKYSKDYGVLIDKYLLHATVSYRFLGTSGDGIYDGEGNEDISDEELKDRFESIEEGNENSSSSTIDYSLASKKINMVASLMVEGNFFTGYSVDFSRNGLYYNTLLNSSFLTSYYKDHLGGDTSLEARTKLVDEIFEYADLGREATTEGGMYGPILSDTIVVYLQTCDFNGSYNYRQNERGKKVFDNPLVNEGTNYPLYLSMTDYLKGVIMAELGSKYFKPGDDREKYREGLKAFTVTATTFLLGSFGVDFSPGVSEIYFPSGDCRQVACDPTYGCSYAKIDYGTSSYSTTYSGVDRYVTHLGTKMDYTPFKKPLTAEESSYLDGVLEEVFGEIMVNKGITPATLTNNQKDISRASYYNNKDNPNCGANCLGQDNAMEDSYNGMNYRDILYKYYSGNNYDIINIREDLYITDVDFSNAQYKNNVIFYDQGDYKEEDFCNLSGKTISRYGCGITASAIVTSTLLQDKTYNPNYMNDLASNRQNGQFCNIGGTNASFFKYFADFFGFSHQVYNKGQGNLVVEALKTGKSLVIAHMGQGDFTNDGHYIVLSAINEKGEVYVHDPNNRYNKSKRGSGNDWYDINTIAKQLKGNFYVISKG